MKKLIYFLTLVLAVTSSASALSYEEAFDSIKAMPNMKGVQGTEVSGANMFESIGVVDGQFILWDNESADETETYGNKLYSLAGQLPVSEMVQGRMYGNSFITIFAKQVTGSINRIIILFDSAAFGLTGALIGYINNENLAALHTAIIKPNESGGMSIYLKAMDF